MRLEVVRFFFVGEPTFGPAFGAIADRFAAVDSGRLGRLSPPLARKPLFGARAVNYGAMVRPGAPFSAQAQVGLVCGVSQGPDEGT